MSMDYETFRTHMDRYEREKRDHEDAEKYREEQNKKKDNEHGGGEEKGSASPPPPPTPPHAHKGPA